MEVYFSLNGQLARPKVGFINEPETKNQSLGNDAYSDAMHVLTKARRDLEIKSPCEENPSLWDGIDFEEGEKGLGTEALRVVDAITGCLTSCPVLEQCEALRMAQGASQVVSGVLAGVWQDDSPMGQQIDYYLSEGHWPEGASV